MTSVVTASRFSDSKSCKQDCDVRSDGLMILQPQHCKEVSITSAATASWYCNSLHCREGSMTSAVTASRHRNPELCKDDSVTSGVTASRYFEAGMRVPRLRRWFWCRSRRRKRRGRW